MVIQGTDAGQLAGRGRIRDSTDGERPVTVAAADIEVTRGDAVTGDDPVHGNLRSRVVVSGSEHDTAAEDLEGRRTAGRQAGFERRGIRELHRVHREGEAGSDGGGAVDDRAFRGGSGVGSEGGRGSPVAVKASIDEAEVRDVGDELNLISAGDPRREHAIGDGDRRGDRRERILETDARHAGGTAGDLNALVHAEETPRVIGRENTDNAIIAILAADILGLNEAAKLEGGGATAGVAAHFEGAAANGGDDADLLGHFVVAIAVKGERRRIEGDRGAIMPAALAARAFGLGDREDARRIVEAEHAVRAELEVSVSDDVARVVGLDDGATEAAQNQITEDLGRSRGQLAAGFERRVIVHHRGTSVILVLEEDRRTTAVAAGDVIELINAAVDRADEQVGDIAVVLVGDDVGVAVTAEVESVAARAEAVRIGGTHAEGGAVIGAAEADEIGRAAEEGRAVADLRQIEVLRVDRIQVDRDRARVATEAGGVGRIRQNRVGEVLGAAQAADAEVDGRQREVARDTDDTEGAEARTDVELAGPAGGHVARGVELDARITLREDITARELGRVVERDQPGLAGAEEGDAAVLDEATHGRPAVAADVEAAPTLLINRARARHRARQRRVIIDREVRIPGRRKVTELGDIARTTGDRQVGRTERSAEDEILEKHRLVGHAEIEPGRSAVPSFVVERRILAEDERRRRDRLKRTND